jgi:acetate kinase
MRELLASPSPDAAFAVRLFCRLAAKQGASLLVPLEGLDAVVFTGGIGENAAPVRAQIAREWAWLGLSLDAESNARGDIRIHAPQSAVSAFVLRTDEEAVLARAAAPWAAGDEAG